MASRSRALPRDPGGESSSSTSPERAIDEDNDFFMLEANDSQSSIGVGNFRDLRVNSRHERDRDTPLPPIYKLPPEILIAIFSRLSSPVDMLNCMKVSSNWAVNCVAHSISDEDSYFPYYDLVKRLNLTTLKSKVNDGTVFSFVKCKRIERLTLTGCVNLTDKGISDLVEGNRQLQALDVSDLDALTDHSLNLVAGNCSRLQGLNITGCVNITDDSLVTLAQSCRQLKRLKFNGVVQITDRSIQAFAKNCPSMLEIDLHGCRNITNVSVTALLGTLRNLRELRLAHCVQITDEAFLKLPDNLIFDTLRILDLTACERVKDDAVEKIIDSAPRLRNLVLGKCKFITDRSVNAIYAAVIQMVKSCNRIRYIDLACCNRLTDKSVEQLATLPKLRRIGLVKCQAITDRSILALAKPRIPQHPLVSGLERVHLSYCVNLTLEGIHSLLNYCPRLTHLSLTGVHAFLREDLTVFCRDAPPDFTQLQRDVFCVFSGDGVGRLRDFLNHSALRERVAGVVTMYDDAESPDEVDSQPSVTGLLNATAINEGDDHPATGPHH
ncbi:SCF E3 ubiquitin ligase complex F-box protein grrA [Arthroderma uncinatum]|uniref:SCF E3 ubiquitin ligase complex F-box protein grrA n=1 Tax=Arthroderma uncinatum TaxID=74035 RepID=UPI00144A7843|nr:SCF E3 ubiquitin ligase complex F-box protein grrA [Arthroderma uncinatum]KAF3491592.1 SCF E3 ubiquitin ligase complex F-box protein grrA [Arthroderma uncinatum]